MTSSNKARPQRRWSRGAALTAGLALAASSMTACATDRGGDDSSYAGETVELIVPFGPGGGNDLTARVLAPYLEEYLPGNPTVQVVNVESNGDYRVGTNDFARESNPDGTQILFGSGSTHAGSLYDVPGVEYDLDDFTPVMGFPFGTVFYVSPETGIETAADLLDPDVQLYSGGREPVGGELYRVSSYHALDLDVEELWGYGGQNDVLIAFEQGEINIAGATAAAYNTTISGLVEEGRAVPVYTMGQLDESGELIRDPQFPDLPHVGEVYEELYGEPMSSLGEENDAFKMQLAAGLMLSVWVHGDAPEARQEALQTAAEEIAQDEDFLAEAARELGDYPPAVGDELDTLIQTSLQDVDQDTIEWLRGSVRDRYDIDLQ